MFCTKYSVLWKQNMNCMRDRRKIVESIRKFWHREELRSAVHKRFRTKGLGGKKKTGPTS